MGMEADFAQSRAYDPTRDQGRSHNVQCLLMWWVSDPSPPSEGELSSTKSRIWRLPGNIFKSSHTFLVSAPGKLTTERVSAVSDKWCHVCKTGWMERRIHTNCKYLCFFRPYLHVILYPIIPSPEPSLFTTQKSMVVSVLLWLDLGFSACGSQPLWGCLSDFYIAIHNSSKLTVTK